MTRHVDPRYYVHAEQFRLQRLHCAYTRRQASSTLGVTERTVRNWEAGRTRIPYAAFKLLRILGGYFLPGAAWRGFYLRGDTLWSPEGKPFQATDLAWWGLTVAMARSWRESRNRAVQPSQPVASSGYIASRPDPLPFLPAMALRTRAGHVPRRRPARGGARRCACGLCGVAGAGVSQGAAGMGTRSGPMPA